MKPPVTNATSTCRCGICSSPKQQDSRGGTAPKPLIPGGVDNHRCSPNGNCRAGRITAIFASFPAFPTFPTFPALVAVVTLVATMVAVGCRRTPRVSAAVVPTVILVPGVTVLHRQQQAAADKGQGEQYSQDDLFHGFSQTWKGGTECPAAERICAGQPEQHPLSARISSRSGRPCTRRIGAPESIVAIT